MTREEAERLLGLGIAGVGEWNRRRAEGDPVPSLREVDVSSADLTGINLSGVRLLGGCFMGANLTNADCRGAVLFGGYFGSAILRESCFMAADLRHSRFGVFSAGLGHCGPAADLSGADFSQARLFKADLSESIMDGTRFDGADLTRADLRYCNLTRADLADATLDFAVLRHVSPQSPLIPQRSHFGKWLKGQREAQGLTPNDLADKLGYGLTGYDVETFLESKEEGVSKYLAGHLAMILKVPIAEVPLRRDA